MFRTICRGWQKRFKSRWRIFLINLLERVRGGSILWHWRLQLLGRLKNIYTIKYFWRLSIIWRSRWSRRRVGPFWPCISWLLICWFRLWQLLLRQPFKHLRRHRISSRNWVHPWSFHMIRSCLQQPMGFVGLSWFCDLWPKLMEQFLWQQLLKQRRVSFIWCLFFCAIFSILWLGNSFFPFCIDYRKRLNQIYVFLILKLLEYEQRLYLYPRIQHCVTYRLMDLRHELRYKEFQIPYLLFLAMFVWTNETISGLIGVWKTAGNAMCLAVTFEASSAENTDTKGTDVIC